MNETLVGGASFLFQAGDPREAQMPGDTAPEIAEFGRTVRAFIESEVQPDRSPALPSTLAAPPRRGLTV